MSRFWACKIHYVLLFIASVCFFIFCKSSLLDWGVLVMEAWHGRLELVPLLYHHIFAYLSMVETDGVQCGRKVDSGISVKGRYKTPDFKESRLDRK